MYPPLNDESCNVTNTKVDVCATFLANNFYDPDAHNGYNGPIWVSNVYDEVRMQCSLVADMIKRVYTECLNNPNTTVPIAAGAATAPGNVNAHRIDPGKSDVSGDDCVSVDKGAGKPWGVVMGSSVSS